MLHFLLNIFLNYPAAPSLVKSKNDIVVMVIDTGVARHKDLVNVVYDETGNYTDSNGHGTHIAGLIESGTNHTRVCPQVKIISCKYYGDNGTADDGIVKCVQYATEMGVDYINLSGGGASFMKDEYEAFKAFKGITYAAAGNDSHELTENFTFFPASYSYNIPKLGIKALPKVRVVQSYCSNIRASYSNYREGAEKVCGTRIKSTLNNNDYGVMSGTSQATAIALHKELLDRCAKLGRR